MVPEDFDAVEIDPDDVGSAEDAANLMGLPTSASVEEIQDKFTELVLQWHPDQAGEEFRDTFIALQKARDLLVRYAQEGTTEEEAAEARSRGAPESPGTGGFGRAEAEKQEQYRNLYSAIKIFFVENIVGKNIDTDDFEEAVNRGEITQSDINQVTEVLRQNYGMPDLTLDDMARVLASLVVQGAINFGDVSKMGTMSGAFGGGDTGAFGRRSRGNDMSGVFR